MTSAIALGYLSAILPVPWAVGSMVLRAKKKLLPHVPLDFDLGYTCGCLMAAGVCLIATMLLGTN